MIRRKDWDSPGINFKVGDRFKLTALGSQRCPRLTHKVGIITSMNENSSIIGVRFDGNKTSTRLHRDYIEPIEAR
jgi:hypothetical protein